MRGFQTDHAKPIQSNESGDLNPDEGVWSWTKYGQLANLAANDKQELWDWVLEELVIVKHRPDLLSGFIQQTKLPGLTLAA